MRNGTGDVVTAEVRARGAQLQSEIAIRPEDLPGLIRQYIHGERSTAPVNNLPESPSPRLSLGERIAGTRFGRVRQPDDEARARFAKFQLDINITNREYYRKYQRMRFQRDAANNIAALLTSFQQAHPLEWEYCGWKTFAIAELMLGRLASSPDSVKSRRAAAERWWKGYWNRKQKIARETDTYLSPTRMAASAAVFELEMLQLADDPKPWMRPGFSDYAAFVRWLNKKWDKLAAKKQGEPLLDAAAGGFLRERPKTVLSNSDLKEICTAYKGLESSYPLGGVPTYQVVLTVVARRHNVSPRLANKVRADKNKRMRSHSTPKKVHS